jgi:hypothetical protein
VRWVETLIGTACVAGRVAESAFGAGETATDRAKSTPDT